MSLDLDSVPSHLARSLQEQLRALTAERCEPKITYSAEPSFEKDSTVFSASRQRVAEIKNNFLTNERSSTFSDNITISEAHLPSSLRNQVQWPFLPPSDNPHALPTFQAGPIDVSPLNADMREITRYACYDGRVSLPLSIAQLSSMHPEVRKNLFAHLNRLLSLTEDHNCDRAEPSSQTSEIGQSSREGMNETTTQRTFGTSLSALSRPWVAKMKAKLSGPSISPREAEMQGLEKEIKSIVGANRRSSKKLTVQLDYTYPYVLNMRKGPR